MKRVVGTRGRCPPNWWCDVTHTSREEIRRIGSPSKEGLKEGVHVALAQPQVRNKSTETTTVHILQVSVCHRTSRIRNDKDNNSEMRKYFRYNNYIYCWVEVKWASH